MDQPKLDQRRLSEVKASFSGATEGESRHAFYSHLFSASVELDRCLSAKPFPIAASPVDRAKALHRALWYLSSRLNDLFVRQVFIRWLRREFVSDPAHYEGLWNSFARLAVKDFHADIASLMDATAPVAILLDSDLKKDDRQSLPGFADIQRETKRSYRTQLKPDIVRIIDATDDWWLFVKRIRQIVLHREHSRVVFSTAESGFLFQVYQDGATPIVTHRAFAAATGTNVSDFLLYSTWVTAEVFYFLDRLGVVLLKRLRLKQKEVITAMGEGDFGEFLAHLDVLISNVKEDPSCA